MRFLHRGRDQQGDVDLTDDALVFRPKLTVPLRDIERLDAADYRVRLTLHPAETLEIYHLGPRYAEFVDQLVEKRNAILARELFLADRKRIETFQGRFAAPDAAPVEGRIDLYPRTLVFYPKNADPFFLRIAEIDLVREDKEHYLVEVRGEFSVTVTYLGLKFEEFQERIRRTRTSMEQRTAKLLEKVAKGAGRHAPRMLDGAVICETGAPELAGFVDPRLKSIASGPAWIGIQERAGSDLDDVGAHRIWYYVPLSGGRVAHEVVNEPDHATYVYRAEIAKINRVWAMIQFRKDVILQPEKYPLAHRKLPHLREIAGAIVGRAIHNESWEAQLAKLAASPGPPYTPGR